MRNLAIPIAAIPWYLVLILALFPLLFAVGCRAAGNKEYEITIHVPAPALPLAPGVGTGTTPATVAVPAVSGQATGAVVVNIIDASYTHQTAPKTLEDVLNPAASVAAAPGSSASASATRVPVAERSAPPVMQVADAATPTAVPSPAPITP